MPYTIIIVALVVFASFFLIKHLKKKAAEQKRISEYNDKLFQSLSDYKVANKMYQQLMSLDTYINHYKVNEFQQRYKILFGKFEMTEVEDLAKDDDVKDEILNFIINFKNIEREVDRRNKKYIDNELIDRKELFDDIEGKSLDLNQRKSIITDEDNNLIIAGAGTGKTLTIAGKVKYLVERHLIVPSDILLISFAKNSALEMQNRIKFQMGIDVDTMTFHKLGLDIIASVKDEKPSIADMSRKKILEIFASFVEHLRKNAIYNDKYTDFLIHWMTPLRQEDEFKSNKEYVEYMQDQKCEGLKMVTKGNFTYREKLKSQEEVQIANFFFKNNIDYRYEEKYKYKTASKKFGQYKPDFYLPKYDIYIEHFGVDKTGNVPLWFKGDNQLSGKEKYHQGIRWKRSEHKIHGTTLIETYSWENNENVLLKNLKEKLDIYNVTFNPMTNDEILDYISQNSRADIDNLISLFSTFSTLLKSNNQSVLNLKYQAQAVSDERVTLFLDLVDPLVVMYNQVLLDEGEIDFSDMINNATSLVESGQYMSPYQYIIIDEFQDVSSSRYQLIKSLLDSKPASKLFCVGDDWQSIFRFAGSDIGLFTDFNNVFESSSCEGFHRKTVTSYIDKTYRFYQELIEQSSRFILKNPNQINKTLKSNKVSDDTPITLFSYSNDSNAGSTLFKVFSDINLRSSGDISSILLLGRYNHDFDLYVQDLSKHYNKTTNSYFYISKSFPDARITFKTVHSAKGLEADYVVLLNGNAGKYGFPSEVADDPILNFLLSDSDTFLNGEERRLFYVAMTRCREHFYILSNSNYRSKFIDEMFPNQNKSEKSTCPWCDMGELIVREGPYGSFHSCNNYHYCNYTISAKA